MNTRLQVEHPVTEAVTGVDLVRAQLHVAAGGTLPWRQEELEQRGHAIECRVYAEDPASGFLPQAGPLLVYQEPVGPGIRVDSGVEQGAEVPVQYDPMLAKLIGSAETRAAAIARTAAALRRFPVLGVRTNIPFLIKVLEHPAFAAGDLHTGFIDAHLPDLLQVPEPPQAVRAAAEFARANVTSVAAAAAGRPDPWAQLRRWGR
jgi:acetyl/propionyl-CoA carboxylase alpha subunit